MKSSATNRSMDTIKTVAFAMALFCFLISPKAGTAAWSQEQPDGQASVKTIHDSFAEIGMKVHGFGGMFVDEEKDTL